MAFHPWAVRLSLTSQRKCLNQQRISRKSPLRAPSAQGYRIWNFLALGRGRRLGFRPLWSSLGRRDAFVRRKLGRRGSNAIALVAPRVRLPLLGVVLYVDRL